MDVVHLAAVICKQLGEIAPCRRMAQLACERLGCMRLLRTRCKQLGSC